MNKKLIVLPILLLLSIKSANAAVYECQIKDSMAVQANGELGKNKPGYLNSKFIVDSKKGTILGSYISNQREFAEKPQIFGSDWVKIFTIVGGPFVKFPLLLEIRTSGLKFDPQALPFTAFYLSEVFAGLCKVIDQ